MKIKGYENVDIVRERERELHFNKIKSEIGITLVALVVTIIILLILAGISIASLIGNGLFEKAKLAKEKQTNAQIKEKNTLNQYDEQVLLELYGSRDLLTLKSCEINISHDKINTNQGIENVNTILNVQGVENIKKVIIAKDGKYFDSTNKTSYRIPCTVQGKNEFYVIVIDENMNIYKSNVLNCNIEYPFNENDLVIYWYGTEENENEDFGTWTQYSSWWKINRDIDNIVFTGGHTSSGGVVAGFTTKQKVDLSLYKAMHIIFKSTATAGNFNIVSSLGDQGSYGNEGGVLSNFEKVSEPTEYKVDLTSVTGSYYIGTQLWGAKGDYKVLRMVA